MKKINGADLIRAVGLKSQSFLNKEIELGNLVRTTEGKKKFYDLDNLVNRDWFVRRGGNPDDISQSAPIPVKPKIKPPTAVSTPDKNENTLPSLPEVEADSNSGDFDIISGIPEKMLGMTIRELVLQYEGNTGLKSYVDILDKLMSARTKDLKIQEIRKDLVSKDFIVYLTGYVNTLMNQLFDYAESVAIQIIPLARADEDIAKIKIPELLKTNFSKLAEQTQRQIKIEIKKHNKDKIKDGDTAD